MNPTLKNILAVVAGLIVGSMVNMGLIMISGSIIPPPEGVDLTTEEGLKAGMHLMGPQHFVFPFLAHALGTLVGAFLVAFFAATKKMIFAMVIGALFLFGGIWMVFILPSPLWFTILDLVVAYLPMAWLGGKLALQLRPI